ncbi:MAG: hypothetical protein ABIH42_03805, partial [Planctomycetota bacterium]
KQTNDLKSRTDLAGAHFHKPLPLQFYSKNVIPHEVTLPSTPILERMEEPTTPPAIAPARGPPDEYDVPIIV